MLSLDVDRDAVDDEGSTAADRAELLRETAVADLLAAA